MPMACGRVQRTGPLSSVRSGEPGLLVGLAAACQDTPGELLGFTESLLILEILRDFTELYAKSNFAAPRHM